MLKHFKQLFRPLIFQKKSRTNINKTIPHILEMESSIDPKSSTTC